METQNEDLRGIPAERWPDDAIQDQARLITRMFGHEPPKEVLFNTAGAASYFYRVLAEAEKRGLHILEPVETQAPDGKS